MKLPWRRYMPKRYGMKVSSGSTLRIWERTPVALRAWEAQVMKCSDVIQSSLSSIIEIGSHFP